MSGNHPTGYESIVILGAPRSGTNMLRDVLTALPDFGTWPCDEINFLWKHGNLSWPTDDLPAERANDALRRFMAGRFAAIARQQGTRHVVEKTCANSLRVSFVAELLPEARYLLLVRDGIDAVASTIKRWQSPVPGGAYYWQKFKYVAPLDRPRVLFDALTKRLRGKVGGGTGHWDTWGPVFPDLLRALQDGRSLAEICALQWSRCVTASIDQLQAVPADRRLAVRYEDFVAAPAPQLARILTFLGQDLPEETLAAAVAQVSGGSVGKGKAQLDGATLQAIAPIIAPAEEAIATLSCEAPA